MAQSAGTEAAGDATAHAAPTRPTGPSPSRAASLTGSSPGALSRAQALASSIAAAVAPAARAIVAEEVKEEGDEPTGGVEGEAVEVA